GSEQVIGPLSGIVLESDLVGEQTVRHLRPGDLQTLEVAPGARAHTTVTWDGKRDDGFAIPAATFSLALDFIVGGANERLGTTILVLALLVVARLKGLAALAGLASSVAVFLLAVVPALRGGSDPLVATIFGCLGVIAVSVFVVHGLNRKSLAALCGTMAGLGV